MDDFLLFFMNESLGVVEISIAHHPAARAACAACRDPVRNAVLIHLLLNCRHRGKVPKAGSPLPEVRSAWLTVQPANAPVIDIPDRIDDRFVE